MGGGGGGGDGATNKCEFLLCTRIFVNVDVIGKYSMSIWSGWLSNRVHLFARRRIHHKDNDKERWLEVGDGRWEAEKRR